MRISCRKEDSGYVYDTTSTLVYVDGILANECFTADEELGIAYCYKIDKKGTPKVHASLNYIEEIEIKGKVVIKGQEPK